MISIDIIGYRWISVVKDLTKALDKCFKISKNEDIVNIKNKFMFNFWFKKIRTDKKIELQKKFPDTLLVEIEPFDDGEGYYIQVKNLEGCNTSTRSKDSKELFEMINDAVYTYLEVPEEYQLFMPTYLPLENVRKEFEEGIPADFLNKTLMLSKV